VPRWGQGRAARGSGAAVRMPDGEVAPRRAASRCPSAPGGGRDVPPPLRKGRGGLPGSWAGPFPSVRLKAAISVR